MKEIFWDVDTQKDFMKEDGALYVPGAEEIIPKLKEIDSYAKKKGYPILGSVDAHEEGDDELKRNGGPFPDHCMKGSEGQKKIQATQPRDALYVPGSKKVLQEEIEKHLSKDKEVYFEKQDYDVFTNQNVEEFLEKSDVERAVIYGVTTEYCVKAAAEGMEEKGLDVYVVEDGIQSIDKEEGKQAIKEMKNKDINFSSFEEIKEKLEVGQ